MFPGAFLSLSYFSWLWVNITRTKYPIHNRITALHSGISSSLFLMEMFVLTKFLLLWLTDKWVFQQKVFQRTGACLCLSSSAVEILTYVAHQQSVPLHYYDNITYPSTSSCISLSSCATAHVPLLSHCCSVEPLLCSCPCGATQVPTPAFTTPLVLHHSVTPSPPKPSRAQAAAADLMGGSDNVGVN